MLLQLTMTVSRVRPNEIAMVETVERRKCRLSFTCSHKARAKLHQSRNSTADVDHDPALRVNFVGEFTSRRTARTCESPLLAAKRHCGNSRRPGRVRCGVRAVGKRLRGPPLLDGVSRCAAPIRGAASRPSLRRFASPGRAAQPESRTRSNQSTELLANTMTHRERSPATIDN